MLFPMYTVAAEARAVLRLRVWACSKTSHRLVRTLRVQVSGVGEE